MNSTRTHPEGVGCVRGAFRPRTYAAITEVLGLQLGYCEGLCRSRLIVALSRLLAAFW